MNISRIKAILTAAVAAATLMSAATAAEATDMKINVTSNGRTVVFELNDTEGAKSLYENLPIKAKVEDYASREKIFFPKNKLQSAGSPSVHRAHVGTLAYYESMDCIVFFYKPIVNTYPAVKELGRAVEGAEFIRDFKGSVEVTR